MDNTSYRSNRHATQSQPTPAEPTPAPAQPERSERSSSKRPKKQLGGGSGMKTKIIVGVVVVLLLLIGWWFFIRSSSVAGNIDSGKVQAVFFTNGQVYFGKLRVVNSDYMKLTDIYYLQTKTAQSGENPQETSTESSSNVELIKLGDEIHGPEDEMIFSKDQVLFFENLKKDGNVSSTIQKYQEQKN